MKRPIVYIGFGSNLGRRQRIIENALNLIRSSPGMRLLEVSSLYETSPVGPIPQPNFLNGVAKFTTILSPRALLIRLQGIEKKLGRRKNQRWAPRHIDLDILCYGHRQIQNAKLTVPHAYYHTRRFVLIPFCELTPFFRHPVLKRSNQWLLRRLTPQSQRVTMVGKWKKVRFYPSKKRSVKTSRLSL